eukprot:jgi/Botrbrau1/20123/Bobra.0173s0025.1
MQTNVSWLGALPSCSTQLFTFFKKDVTVHLINQANSILRAAFKENTAVTYGNYLYQRVLFHLLLSHANESTWQEYARSIIVQNDFQVALLMCAVEIVAYILPNHPSFPTLTVQLGRLSKVLDLWEAIRCYRVCFAVGSKECHAMPADVAEHLSYMRIRIVEELIWCNGSSIYQALQAGGGGCHEHGDFALVNEVLWIAKRLAESRLAAICELLSSENEELQTLKDFPGTCHSVLAAVFDSNLDLTFGQHLNSLVSCAIYGSARLHQVVSVLPKDQCSSNASITSH